MHRITVMHLKVVLPIMRQGRFGLEIYEYGSPRRSVSFLAATSSACSKDGWRNNEYIFLGFCFKMGDAALKLARRALAGGGPDSCTNAVNVLNYYVEREAGVASDTRVWAALHYLYTQLEDHAGSKRCLKKIDALGGGGCTATTPVRKRQSTHEGKSPAAIPARLCGSRRSPSPEAKRKFALRFEEKRLKSRKLRERGSVLFDSTNLNTNNQKESETGGAYYYGGKVDGLLWKSKLLQARGRLLVQSSSTTQTNPDSSHLFEGSTQGAAEELETAAISFAT